MLGRGFLPAVPPRLTAMRSAHSNGPVAIGAPVNAGGAARTTGPWMGRSLERLERELQPVFCERGSQSLPLHPWRSLPDYFPLSSPVWIVMLQLSMNEKECQAPISGIGTK